MTPNTTDPMIGRLVDGRYQVRSRIARGGMATVYLATDLRLERRVAVKVMHGHLADDTQYRARFIQEARSAARLAHPNVVNVYDQGQDDDTAYLVMEYLPGITLRDLLQEHHVLTTDQAFDILESVLSGLAAAHRNGIVHRDLKPENVLLADDGRIKIGDFGLARAATANTATGNALLGTIAYLSPELVTRGIADTRSDIYAVGIMFYEMLAGEQPFKGEQAFQIAHQHANDTVGRPSAVNPAVPPELDELVLWATARDPDHRPRDAREMLDQLLVTQEAMRTGAATAATALLNTAVLPPAPAVGAAWPPAAPAATAATAATQVLGATAAPVAAPPTPPKARAVALPRDPVAALGAKAARRGPRGWLLLLLVFLLAAGAGATGWYFNTGPGAQVEVPQVVGADVPTATASLTAADLVVGSTPTEVFDPVAAVGTVVGTDPTTGATVLHGTAVTLLVSKGPEPLPIPALTGLAEQDALALVTAGRFTTTDSRYEFTDDSAAGTVLRALGADDVDLSTLSDYPDQRPITLVVSRGPIPDVAGSSLADASAALADVGLVAVEGDHQYSNSIPEGDVISAVPRTEVVVPNDSIDLVISEGPAPVAVPDLTGLGRNEAIAELEALGLKASYNPLFAPFPEATVTGSDPSVDDDPVRAGSTVNLFLQLIG